MKTALVYLYDRLAGRLTEDENGFTFCYDREFLASDDAEAVSLTLPERSWKINQRDRMSLLMVCCKDCIGAVSVIPEKDEE